LKLFYCPTCTRVYNLDESATYLCGRNHDVAAWPDGTMRRLVITVESETNRPPWPIPAQTEEQELLRETYSECWIRACENPDDSDFGDVRRHFGYGAPGGKHLNREELVQKYAQYVLKPVQG
jgi:hypothetical protein